MAVALARALGDGVVINADASQVYVDIPILSACPTEPEMAGVPHRLFGHVDGAEAHNAARWSEEARAAISHAHDAGKVPILVGGTGLYLRTLLDGIAPVPPIDDAIRAEVRALPVGDAYRRLQDCDSHAAARLKPLDKTRVARALEVALSTGVPLHRWQERCEGGIGDAIDLTALVLLPPRDRLVARCDARLAAMFDAGAHDEVLALLERRLDPDLPVMRAIGVPQIAAWIDAQIGEAEALAQAQLATRRYAKRQYTWFRHQPPPSWRRYEESLSIDSINELAILLRDTVLTG